MTPRSINLSSIWINYGQWNETASLRIIKSLHLGFHNLWLWVYSCFCKRSLKVTQGTNLTINHCGSFVNCNSYSRCRELVFICVNHESFHERVRSYLTKEKNNKFRKGMKSSFRLLRRGNDQCWEDSSFPHIGCNLPDHYGLEPTFSSFVLVCSDWRLNYEFLTETIPVQFLQNTADKASVSENGVTMGTSRPCMVGLTVHFGTLIENVCVCPHAFACALQDCQRTNRKGYCFFVEMQNLEMEGVWHVIGNSLSRRYVKIINSSI